MKNLFITLLLICFSNIVYAQWQATNGPPYGAVRCIATQNSTVFAAPSAGGIYKSVDNGDNWLVTSLQYGGANAIVLNDSTVFVGSGHGVYRSTDFGATWTLINNGLTDTIITSLALKGTSIFAGTYSNGIFLSTNNGANWIPVNNGITNPYIKSLAVHDSIIYAGTSWWNGGVFYSTNNGSSWTSSNIGLPDADVCSFAFSGTNIFAGLYNRGIFVSSNLSSNWIPSSNGLIDTTFQCLYSTGNYVLAGFAQSGIYFTNDYGNNWIPFNTGFMIGAGARAFTSNDNYFFVATGGNGVWRRSLEDIVGVNKTDKGNSISINLYPNPNTGSMTLDYMLEKDESGIMVINDIAGRSVAEYTLNANSNSVVINENRLKNGIYYYSIYVNGVMLKTNRIVIIK